MIWLLLLILLFCFPRLAFIVIAGYAFWLFINAVGWIFIAVLVIVAALLIYGFGMEPDTALLVATALMVAMGHGGHGGSRVLAQRPRVSRLVFVVEAWRLNSVYGRPSAMAGRP